MTEIRDYLQDSEVAHMSQVKEQCKLQYIIYPLNVLITIAHMHSTVLHYLSKKYALITNIEACNP